MNSPIVSSQYGPGAMRPRVLIFVGYYLPGYKAGGPIRTISNMVDQLCVDFYFLIVTRDRDFHDHDPYIDIRVNEWNSVGPASVYYASPDQLNLRSIGRLLRETPHDVLYLNSFFSPRTTGLPLFARWLRLCPTRPVVIAPRGEFSKGALVLKAIKKRLYIKAMRLLGIYRGLTWQASSSDELEDIRREIGVTEGSVVIAPNLVAKSKSTNQDVWVEDKMRQPGPLRIVFLSRISPKKNLDYLLRVLRQVTASAELNIWGPAEDLAYWHECQKLMEEMPVNIRVNYHGAVTPDCVPKIFRAHDVFVFPTHGENFGHVIIEALGAGTAVIVSDQTPWKPDDEGACQIIPLSNMNGYVAVIQQWASFSDAQLATRRQAALAYTTRHSTNADILKANRDLFHGAIESFK